jgi:antitoxin component YwqK of YwqJK toxin-antitoxin module
MGKLQCVSYVYWKTGKKAAELRFINGIKEGKQLIYYDNVDSILVENYEKGVKQ